MGNCVFGVVFHKKLHFLLLSRFLSKLKIKTIFGLVPGYIKRTDFKFLTS